MHPQTQTSEDTQFGSKYDRQLRLWSSTGQSALQRSHLLLVNVSCVATETLKNLVLPGLHSITIIDNTSIEKNDVASNFFFTKSHLGFSKSAVLAQQLSELNPDVNIAYINNKPLASLLYDHEFWSQFTLVIYAVTTSTLQYLPQLSTITWKQNVPFLTVTSLGFYAYLTTHIDEQIILETHEQSTPDLRIDSQWPELQSYVDSLEISSKNPNYYQIPYSLILSKLYTAYLQQHSQRPKPAEIRALVKSLYVTNDEMNLDEAYNKAYLVMKDSKELPCNVSEIFNDSQASCLTSDTPIYWILVKALHHFYSEFQTLPISGSLPDMESDTSEYLRLKEIYEEKFSNDKSYIRKKTYQLLFQLGRKSDELDESLLHSFVKNCNHIKLIRGAPLRETTANPVYNAFLWIHKFQQQNGRYPTPDDDIAGENSLVAELCRAKGHELHNIAAIMGGIAAQEIIKILTKQYIPVENAVAFDGVLGKAITFKI